MAETIEVKVPDIGDFDAVDVIEILVSPGDQVEKEQSLITLESDKASMEVPSSHAGKVKEVKIKVGDQVGEGDVIVLLEAEGESGGDSGTEAQAEAAPAEQKSEPASSGGGGTVEVKVPDIGDFDEVDVIEVLVSEGDEVEAEQSLITLESDKASMEVPSSHAGRIKQLKIKVGDKVGEGDVIALLEAAGGGSAPAESAPAEKPVESKAAERSPVADPIDFANKVDTDDRPAERQPIDREKHRFAHASPAVRAFARELGVDLGNLDSKGSGKHGRITKDDVKAYIKSVMKGGVAQGAAAGGSGIPPIPAVDFSKFGEIEKVPLTRIQKLSGPHLHRSWVNVPHVTQFDECDITEMEAFRKAMKDEAAAEGVKLTPLAFLLKACATALVKYPRFNSSLAPEGDALIMKKYVNIGVAVDTPDGLVVPVVKDADKKGLYELAADLGELSKKARDGKLSPKDMSGGNFSISSLGGIGGTAFTPIVNAPEVAILGVSKSEMKPVWNGKDFEPRLMLPLSLSYDHRVIDGALAARFTTYLGQVLTDMKRMLL